MDCTQSNTSAVVDLRLSSSISANGSSMRNPTSPPDSGSNTTNVKLISLRYPGKPLQGVEVEQCVIGENFVYRYGSIAANRQAE